MSLEYSTFQVRQAVRKEKGWLKHEHGGAHGGSYANARSNYSVDFCLFSLMVVVMIWCMNNMYELSYVLIYEISWGSNSAFAYG